MLLGGALARAEVAGVVSVHAVGNVREAELCTKGFHNGEKFVLAVETAIGVVTLILRTLELVSGYDAKRHFERFGELTSLLQVAAGEAGRVGQHGEHARAQDAMRGCGQECRIDTAGVSDHKAAQLRQARFKSGETAGCLRLTGRSFAQVALRFIGAEEAGLRVSHHGSDYSALTCFDRAGWACAIGY